MSLQTPCVWGRGLGPQGKKLFADFFFFAVFTVFPTPYYSGFIGPLGQWEVVTVYCTFYASALNFGPTKVPFSAHVVLPYSWHIKHSVSLACCTTQWQRKWKERPQRNSAMLCYECINVGWGFCTVTTSIEDHPVAHGSTGNRLFNPMFYYTWLLVLFRSMKYSMKKKHFFHCTRLQRVE